jgi:hypothetical protein
LATDDWSREEAEATVADYFAMLAAELGALAVNKAEHNRHLRRLLRDRSKGSVEFKHQNISAILTLHGYPYIEGYKPRFNFQALLEQVVLEYTDLNRNFFDPLVAGPVLDPTVMAAPDHVDPRGVLDDPPERLAMPVSVWSPSAWLSRIDFVARDAANKELGRRGEEFVLEFERRRLQEVEGQPGLAKRVEWTSRDRGDGAGYDISSFNGDGSARLIEVKTTGLGKYFPFNVTGNEVRCSEVMPDRFQLYRVFKFGASPRIYTLPGSLAESCQLSPVQYRAFVRAAR